MSIGFYHPSRGVWFATHPPTSAILDSYPDGTVSGVPAPPGADYDYDPGSNSWMHNPPDGTIEDVTVERNRRLAAGFTHDFDDARGVHTFATTEPDMNGWDEVTKGAQAAINLGAGSTSFNIVTETGPVSVTATEWQAILVAATAFRQPIWAASFTLQAMNPIPPDFADDSHWP